MTRILFFCKANSCRSQMAEGIARSVGGSDVAVCSAGTAPCAVDARAVKVMAEVGIDISAQRSKGVGDLPSLDFDVVIALCGDAEAGCPTLPGKPAALRWRTDDPAEVQGDEPQAMAAFRQCRDEIRRRVDDLFKLGYLRALVSVRRDAELVLENISDGIIAHDMERRIFHFNRAAERITGFRREDVLNRVCPDVFPGGLCGGKCLFPEGKPSAMDLVERNVEVVTKDGERRHVVMRTRPITDDGNQVVGVLTSFRDLTREHQLERRLGEKQTFSGIIGRDETMLALFDMIRDVAESSAPVLIQGESGTGKELVAAAIHNEGPRAAQPFVPVNCGALPEGLLESELFGHVRGAFTGAIRDKKGRFELADGGTIFLDEIGDISPAMQVKLLRVLQEGKFERVGSESTLQVNVRVISATHKHLDQELAAGKFREDLFYRLSVIPISIPPLRARRNDIPLLAEHVLARFLAERGGRTAALSPEVMDVMLSYDWPGNVREMENWIQFALLKCKGPVIRVEHLPPVNLRGPLPVVHPHHRKLDRESVQHAIEAAGGNKVEAAKMLGISRATLYRFLDSAAAEP